MAVDLGSKRVGLALSDPTRTIATPLRTIDAAPEDSLIERLAEVAREVEAEEIVVGLPLQMNGASGPEAVAARQAADKLRKRSRLPVRLLDERLTSVAAERALLADDQSRADRRRLSDQVAAALLLQAYLEGAGRGR